MAEAICLCIHDTSQIAKHQRPNKCLTVGSCGLSWMDLYVYGITILHTPQILML